MPDDIETEVRNMMANAAALDMGYPWDAVKAAAGRVMDGGQMVDFMERLHEQLLDLGMTPEEP